MTDLTARILTLPIIPDLIVAGAVAGVIWWQFMGPVTTLKAAAAQYWSFNQDAIVATSDLFGIKSPDTGKAYTKEQISAAIPDIGAWGRMTGAFLSDAFTGKIKNINTYILDPCKDSKGVVQYKRREEHRAACQ